MNAVELLDESEGACTGGKFLARSLRVKQHGAILGMRKHRNRLRCHSGAMRQHRTRNLEIPVLVLRTIPE
jgi:hypothetical protein